FRRHRMALSPKSGADAHPDEHSRPAVTNALAEYVSNLTLADVPEEVRERTKFHVLDAIGAGLYGAHLPWCERAVRGAAAVGGSGDVALWGWGRGVSAI